MNTGRHALHLTDDQLAIFHAEAGQDVHVDVPLVSVVHESQDVRWLWQDRIPLGRVTLIEGAARSGKSFVALDLAARVSGGIAWPDSPEAAPAGTSAQPLETCLLICLQDSPGDTLGRRLRLAGGDPSRLLHFSQFQSTDAKKRQTVRSARFPGDLPAVEYLLDKHQNVRLIVIDPLSDFCPVPGLLAETIHRLNDLAAARSISIVATLRAASRFDKRGRLEVKSRWPTEAARCTWFVAHDPDDESRRLFVPTRTNFCVEPQGLGFSIDSGRVVWDIAAKVDFQDPLQNQSSTALWLHQLLAAGDVAVKDIQRLGAECGYTPDMLRYAGRKIGVHKRRIGFSRDGQWIWSLQPPRPEQPGIERFIADRPVDGSRDPRLPAGKFVYETCVMLTGAELLQRLE